MTHYYPRRRLSEILDGIPLTAVSNMEDARQLCDYVGSWANSDLRTNLWDIRIDSLDPLVLSGYVTNPGTLSTLKQAFEHIGTEANTEGIHRVPDPESDEARFGVITVPECAITADPGQGERLDSALLGSSVVLLVSEDEFTQVQAPSGYIGWVHQSEYTSKTSEPWVDWMRKPRGIVLDEIKTGSVTIPRNAMLPVPSPGTLLLPSGDTLSLEDKSVVRTFAGMTQKREQLIEAARSLLGTNYVWGGNSRSGIDCSGFTRYCYRKIGITLPRDADMQSLAGTISAIPGAEDAMMPGDLLFFHGRHGRITHVGMSIDGSHFIHASGRHGVIEDDLDKAEGYTGTYLLSKRILS